MTDLLRDTYENALLPDGRSKNGTPLFRRVCPQCGDVKLVDKRKIGKLCMGCSNRSRATHNLSSHPLYRLLHTIRGRCECRSATHYRYYGGRGIKVCREWIDDPAAFVNWALENGWQKGLDIDRIDNDGDYSPSNCQFITRRENSQKRRRGTTTIEKARAVKAALSSGASITEAASAAGVTYMAAWHIKNSPGVWSNA